MSVRLRPLHEDEYAAFEAESMRQYADDLHQNGGLDRDQAEAKAQTDFATLLPNGLATVGHTITAVERIEDGERVGRLWFAARDANGRTVAYLYDIEIDEVWRGQGLGRAAMRELEREALRQGYDVLELNVFGGNAPARALYRSLGFAETAVSMKKPLHDHS